MSDFFIGMITLLIYVAVMCTWFFALFDLLARNDLSGVGKVAWMFAIIFLPLLGVLVYFIARPATAGWWAPRGATQVTPSGVGIYAQRSDSIAGEVEMLARLKEEGAITDDEFVRMKQRVAT
jgi:hypothetical protein